tara:strand:+ start:181 stop:537 length:357 start_codon:yes stop_codon:yes gene_type:complete
MIFTTIIIAAIVTVILTLRFFAVATPYDNPYELLEQELLEEEEADELQCFRCGATQEITEDEVSWLDEGQVHDWIDSDYDEAVFCDSCYADKDKYGQPYLTDLDEMRANPHNYLPRGM